MDGSPDNLVLEHLRAIREDLARLADRVDTLAVETIAVRHHMAGVTAVHERDHMDIAALKERVDHLERQNSARLA